MMHFHPTRSIAFLAAICLIPSLYAGDIDFTDGEGDLTIFYQSQAQAWHVVFRNKAETEATGLDMPFAGYSGIVDLADDYQFNSLTTHIATATTLNVGGTDYLISSAEGSPFYEEATADLGIRMRMREDFGTLVDQFVSVTLGLNVAGSTYNGNPLGASGKHVGLLAWDLLDNPVAMIDTEGGMLSTVFINWGHAHRHWGFSDYGVYDLEMNIQGVGGLYGATAPTGTFRMTFNVAVPEPSSLSLIVCGMGLLPFHRRRCLR